MVKKLNAASIYLLSLLMFSCTDDKETLDTKVGDGPSLEFVMTRFSENIINNTQVYLFDGQGTAAAGQFKQKIPGVTYKADGVSMPVAAGTWDFMLLSADRDISPDVILPVRGQKRSALKMWETRPSGGVLPSIPELRTACLAGQKILANQENIPAGEVSLVRNAALVKVVIVDAGGLDINGTHTLKLTNVPTTLNWEGGLYPDKDNPAVSAEPMTGTFTVHEKPEEPGRQCSDELSFIIPAHKGSDYLSPNPADTTASHLKLSVDLALEGNTRFKKVDVEIPRVPRVNGTLLVNLTFGGKLAVATEILGWVDHELDVDLSQTLLYTDKASVGLAYKDTLHVNTNAADFTVDKEPGMPWLTVARLDNNAVEVTADVNTYVDNHPRTSYITVKANNVSKKILVTQRPDEGTIKVSVKKMQFSPVHPAGSLSVNSVGGSWKLIKQENPKATASITQGPEGENTSVTFTRTSTYDDAVDERAYDRVYGDGVAVFKNTATLATDTVRLSNLFIGLVDQLIEVAQPIELQRKDTASVVDNVKVYGGDSRDLRIVQKPDWIYGAPATSYNPETGAFTFVCERSPDEEPRDGVLVLSHKDDPDYQVRLAIHQDIIIRIPEFDFFVIQFTWTLNADADIKVGFEGNPTSVVQNGVTYNTSLVNDFQNMYVGLYNPAANVVHEPYIKYQGEELLLWGGDALYGEGETAYFNAKLINAAPYPGQYGISPSTQGFLPRTLNLGIYAWWYSKIRNSPITCTISSYLGGTMVKDGNTNFKNIGGELVYKSVSKFELNVAGSVGQDLYGPICDIIYDRRKHTAKINWTGTPWKEK